MRQILHVDINNYDIEISDNKFSKLMDSLDKFTESKKRLFVISQKVFKLYNEQLNISDSEIFILPDGEKEKNFKNYIKILEKASKIGLTRNDVMIAIGGGVTGDITGFVASTYMRGIDYIQVPTTLLAMVDSSVGGKTAIDLNDIKNLAGTFYQPKAVFININFLKTLDKKQISSGMGEVLKYAFIENSCNCPKPLYFYEFLSLSYDKFFQLDPVTLIRVIDYSLRLKIAVVNQDEKESSLRKILNLGHTVAHALESITNYKKFTHGEAVIYGIFFALKAAYNRKMISYSYYRLSNELLDKYHYKNINICKRFNIKKLVNYMCKDKKAQDDKIVLILPVEKKLVKEVKCTPQEIIDLLNL